MAKPLALLALLLVTVASEPAAARQRLAAHWNELEPLVRGRAVEITLQDGRITRGKAISVAPGSITVESRHGSTEVPRTSVKAIRARMPRSKGRVIGVAVGVGAGIAVSAPIATYLNNEVGGGEKVYGIVLPAFIALGYLVGWGADRATVPIELLPDR